MSALEPCPNKKAYVVIVSELATRTREALAKRPRDLTYAQIEADTGVKSRWLYAFAADAYARPCVHTVETLYVYLTGRTLDV